MQPDFIIQASGSVSESFRMAGAGSFLDACNFVRRMPYRRNREKGNLLAIFADQCGTCSSKHAALKQLAIENSFEKIELMIGIYRMNGINTPKAGPVLKKHGLDYIPEAHCYLKYGGEIIDCTSLRSKGDDFKKDLLQEIRIEPGQAGMFKTGYHKKFLANWLKENQGIKYSLDTVWEIREECIKAISN